MIDFGMTLCESIFIHTYFSLLIISGTTYATSLETRHRSASQWYSAHFERSRRDAFPKGLGQGKKNT